MARIETKDLSFEMEIFLKVIRELKELTPGNRVKVLRMIDVYFNDESKETTTNER